MSSFPDEVRYTLREAGWHEGRSVGTQPYSAAITSFGGAWFAAADKFLQEFGGLHLRFLRHDGSVSNLQVEPPLAVQLPHAQAAHAALSQRLGRPALAVLGQAYGDDLLLLMDEQGRIYGAGCDDCLYLLGSDTAAALAAVCLDLPFEQL
ncbi:SUKH-3 domain-containing protein [Hymenobacter sp. 15J16-1T3B]|uniref:SUKH-3 domain-containing protein n=1 Tax=Hymenobacter sp. 15J16-1T3B TaxID=2886941 RepID=UPI001D106B41|nr:SUKH-3 domain-containing protein [Hymenobacter sp. 15J16-1T3B]MCC3160722.1 SUKH-3 domain-containing protein [Hymenobacter sp. 15J16-1T3B]